MTILNDRKCLICNSIIEIKYNNKHQKYCSRKCFHIYYSKNRQSGEKSNHWIKGKPICKCGKVLSNYSGKKCRSCYISYIKENPIIKKGFTHTVESRNKMSKSQTGRKLSAETINKLKGKVAWNKIIDRTKLKRYTGNNERRSPAYREWRLEVYKRDNYKCRIADNNCDGIIEAHHILGWVEHPELRYQVNNGITLCHAHHPRRRAEEKRLIPIFQELVSVSKELF
jgi:hypothetical protein